MDASCQLQGSTHVCLSSVSYIRFSVCRSISPNGLAPRYAILTVPGQGRSTDGP